MTSSANIAPLAPESGATTDKEEGDGGANILIHGSGEHLLFYSPADDAVVTARLAEFLRLLELAPTPIHVWRAAGWLILAGAAELGLSMVKGKDKPVVAVQDQGSRTPSLFELRPARELFADSEFIIDLNAGTIRHQQPLIGQGAALIERVNRRHAGTSAPESEAI